MVAYLSHTGGYSWRLNVVAYINLGKNVDVGPDQRSLIEYSFGCFFAISYDTKDKDQINKK